LETDLSTTKFLLQAVLVLYLSFVIILWVGGAKSCTGYPGVYWGRDCQKYTLTELATYPFKHWAPAIIEHLKGLKF